MTELLQEFKKSLREKHAERAVQEKLMAAAEAGDSQTVLQLLAEGVDVNGQPNGSVTLLMRVVQRCPLACVAEVVAAGADLNAEDAQGNTALFYAVSRGSIGPLRLLIEAGADTSARGHTGVTLLNYAQDGANHGLRQLEEMEDYLQRHQNGKRVGDIAKSRLPETEAARLEICAARQRYRLAQHLAAFEAEIRASLRTQKDIKPLPRAKWRLPPRR